MENQLLLIRPSKEILNKLKSFKSFPVGSVDGNIPKIIGLVDSVGLRFMLRVSPGNTSESFNFENSFKHIELPEYYSIVGSAKFTTMAHIKQTSPPMRIAPSLFSNYPQYEGQNVMAEAYNKSVNDFILYRESVRPPEPKPAYTGLLSRALQEI